LIPGEDEVPHLARENQDDRRQLSGGLLREDGTEAQQHHGQKGEHGDTLQHIEERHEHLLRVVVPRRRTAIHQGKK
jgi:hypothetical protein